MRQNSLFSIVGLLLVVALGANADDNASKAAALAKALSDAVKVYQAGVTTGIYAVIPNNATINTPLVTLPGNAQLSLGLVTLPLDFLCRQGGLLAAVTCHVCSYDCTFVHNKYGGQCGTAANPMPGTPQETGLVCVCNDSPPTNGGNFTDVETQCGPIIDKAVDEVIDLQVAVTFRQRMFLVQCIPSLFPLLGTNSVGCNTDCTTNHNYRSGTCKTGTAVATFPTETRIGFNCYCAQ